MSREPAGGALPGWMRVLPRRAMSRGVGTLARAPLPRVMLAPALRVYAALFGADLDEAQRGLWEYDSFLDFFTRTLRPGLRPLPADPATVVSPSDGHVHTAGAVRSGFLFQAKGVRYALDDLVADAQTARVLDDGTQITVHLAPGDYHRFHWPFDATVEVVRHVPGDLWPVHPQAARALPGLFAKNERVVVEGRVAGGHAYAIVAVGATNVGSIRLGCLPIRTNRGAPARVRAWRLENTRVERGEEMGFFEMGSTLIVLLSEEAGAIDSLAPGTKLRACQPIGQLADRP